MILSQMNEMQNAGYYWVLSDTATLYRHGKKIRNRHITPAIRKIALLGSMDAFLFGIFGPNGTDRRQYQILKENTI